MPPVVLLLQAVSKHIEQLVTLPDELCETTLKKSRKLCDSCCCHRGNERELAVHLAKERHPQACPLARLL